MNGPEHYDMAEDFLARAEHQDNIPLAGLYTQIAAVHADLARLGLEMDTHARPLPRHQRQWDVVVSPARPT